MAEETIIIRVGFPYLDERLYPAGWRSFNNEILALNNYDIQIQIRGYVEESLYCTSRSF